MHRRWLDAWASLVGILARRGRLGWRRSRAGCHIDGADGERVMISFAKFAGDAASNRHISALPQEAFGSNRLPGDSQGQQFELVVRRHEPARRLAAKTGRACCGKLRRFLLDFRRSPATTSAA